MLYLFSFYNIFKSYFFFFFCKIKINANICTPKHILFDLPIVYSHLIDPISDIHRSNKMFEAMLKKVKRGNMDRAKHYPPIAEADLTKLRQSEAFNLDQPKHLQRKVWFDIALDFARRGRENLQNLKKDAFAFENMKLELLLR